MNQFITVNLELQPTSRHEAFNGRDHLVVPCVALVEGVLNGSLALASEFLSSVNAWNGVPVPVGHPKDAAGNYVPCQGNASAANSVIGVFRNASWEVNKLKGEIWVDVAKATDNGYSALVADLEAGKVLDVSTAFNHTPVPMTGSFNGKSYNQKWTAIKPEHLALLPNEAGACSVADGCGIRVNSAQPEKPRMFAALSKKFKQLMSAAFDANELSNNDVENALRAALQAEDGSRYFWMRDVFADRFVYEAELKNGPPMPCNLLQRSYTVTDTGVVTLGTDVIAVTEQTNYVPLTTNQEDPMKDAPKPAPATNAECACKGAGAPVVVEAVAANTGITADQVAKLVEDGVKAALAANTATAEAEKKGLLADQIVANGSKIPKDQLVTLPLAVLTQLEAETTPKNYGGRGLPISANAVTFKPASFLASVEVKN